MLRIDHRDTRSPSSGGGVGGGGGAITPRLLTFSEFVSMTVRLSHTLYDGMSMTNEATIAVHAYGSGADAAIGNFNRHAVSDSGVDQSTVVGMSAYRGVRSGEAKSESQVDPWASDNDTSINSNNSGYDPMRQQLSLSPTSTS